MKNELISALKNQLVLALVVAGTITIAIPIFVCGLIGVLLEFSLLLVASKTLAVTEKLENWRKPPTQMEHCNRNDRYEPADFAPAALSVFEGPPAREDRSEIPKVLYVTRITSGALIKNYIARCSSNIGSTTMNKRVPFIWRVNYRNEPLSPETVLETAHEKAKEYLQKYLRR